MSNDRLYLRGKHCGKHQLLAKYYPTLGHGVWDERKLADWIEKHMECSPHFGGMDLQGDTCFDIRAESEENFRYPLDVDSS